MPETIADIARELSEFYSDRKAADLIRRIIAASIREKNKIGTIRQDARREAMATGKPLEAILELWGVPYKYRSKKSPSRAVELGMGQLAKNGGDLGGGATLHRSGTGATKL